jgi:hypothetical protein
VATTAKWGRVSGKIAFIQAVPGSLASFWFIERVAQII